MNNVILHLVAQRMLETSWSAHNASIPDPSKFYISNVNKYFNSSLTDVER